MLKQKAQFIICSPVPRNNFKNGKTARSDKDYGLWAKQIAEESGAYFIDLNALIADAYDEMGADAVKDFFPKDHTHPNKEGSQLNASKVVEGIEALEACSLKDYLSEAIAQQFGLVDGYVIKN
ncbi:SGNH/GDSL hydrolase family protein [Niabella ginsengisoli]|uniref:SGNH hydrolase-type esterase domain-containing protein n=1 Tax=Niabella ginsengisoli TaxID=522298 RepID=A0ABS9SGE7_9BACT|nr:hypothetical protein [Niabella ginsengisoli]MCH5597229.1 hypothetical protein [Niabella ginsengisoli]